MFMLETKDVGWWYWLTLSVLLNLSVNGIIDSYLPAIAVATIHLIHYLIKEADIKAFSVQVRITFLVLLLLFLYDPLQWMFWIPAIGTIARWLFGYCLLARLLMLMPNNRNVPLTKAFIIKALFSRPIRGNVLHGLGAYRDIKPANQPISV